MSIKAEENNSIKSVMGMIDLIKACFARISVERDDKTIDSEVDKGIILLEDLDKLIMEGIDKEILITELKDGDESWVSVKDGVLPPSGKDILFTTIAGQVFEGFREDRDLTKPFLNEHGKIDFQKGNGKWYRYHFRDYLPADAIIAWRYKPGAYRE